ncbi:hypothetical protein [Actinophytocola sp. NPDC049390]|uniref:hypothetical protein n=1 Tax=Actinophytocola sp. NPDC049390 TaxID=3363894 RepID=UPI0037AB2260
MSQDSADDSVVGDEYVAILAVDVRRFSEHNGDQQKTIVNLLPEILQQAGKRAGLDDWWDRSKFLAFRGDGYLIGIPRVLIGPLVDKFFDALQLELRRRRSELRALDVEIRLRAALDLGPVRSFDAEFADSPSGEVMVNAARMLDADAVRALLERSDPAVTLVAVVLSSSVMEQVVSAGSTVRVRTEFVEVPLSVPTKAYASTGYLRVPAPSGDLLQSGLLVVENDGEPESTLFHDKVATAHQPEESATAVSNETGDIAGLAVLARDIGGEVRDSSVGEAGANGVTVTGDNNVTAGGDQTYHRQDFSGTFRTLGDSNFGPASGSRTVRDETQPEG